MIPRGTDWRFEAKDRIDIDPVAINDANETRKINPIELIDKVSVRGKEILTTRASKTIFNLGENLGKRPDLTTKGTCIRTCILAPKITPMAIPKIPNCLARKIIPTTIPALYKRGATA